MPRIVQLFAAALLGLALVTGCKSNSQSELQKAFRAGEAQGEILAEAKRKGVSFTGQVMVPIVPWTAGLTLGQAIVAARWTGQRDPSRVIIVSSSGERMELVAQEAMIAANLPLAPGDQVELVP